MKKVKDVKETKDARLIEMKIVDRPMGPRPNWPILEEVKAIANTIETGKAVQLAFRTGEEMKRIQMALRFQVAKLGLKMRYAKGTGDRIIAWAEKASQDRPGRP